MGGGHAWRFDCIYNYHKRRNILTDFQFLYGRCKTSLTMDTDAREEGRGGLAGTSYDVRLILMRN